MLRQNQLRLPIRPGKWATAVSLLLFLAMLINVRPAASDNAGNALAFNGAGNHVILGNMAALMGGTDWASTKTVSVWVKPTAVNSPVTTPTSGELIIGTHGPRTFGITRANYNGQDKLWLWNSDGTLDFIGLDFVPGQWTHIALVHANGLLSAYQDGQFAGSIASGPTTSPGNGTLYLGGNSNSQYFSGEIDEVRLWNAALTESLIADWRYQQLTAVHPQWPTLAAYYQMSNGAGLLLTDDSGHGHAGQLTGGMGDANWVPSAAFGQSDPTPTPTPTTAPATPTVTPSPEGPTPTTTPIPATPTATNTPLPPTVTPSPSPTAVSPTPSANGYALQFDGTSDFVELHETAYMMAAGWESTKTVSLWVRPMGEASCTYPTPVHCDVIFGDRARWWGISRGVVDGLDRIWIWNYDTNTDQIGVPYTLDVWMHIALVHGDGVLRAIVNGVEVGSVPSGPTSQPNTGALPILHIGGIINTSTRNWTFAGQIDEVSLWNVARTAAEISASMNQPLTGSEPGLAAYYAMSNGDGLTLTDDSGHGWDGVLFDGARGVPPSGQPAQWVSPGAIGVGGAPTPTATSLPPTATPTPDLPSPTPTLEPSPTVTVEPSPTMTGEPPPSATPTLEPSSTPTLEPSPTPTVEPSPTAPTPTTTPEPSPTSTITPSPTPGSSVNYALQFDGLNDYVRLGDTGDAFGSTGWIDNKVVSAWVQPTGAVGPATHPTTGQILVGTDRPRNFGISRAVYNGSDRLWVWNSDANGVDMVGIDFTPGEWLHVALVHSNGLLSAYKNGQLVGTVVSSATYVANHGTGDGQAFLGGNGRSTATYYFAGHIDEVRFWDAALDGATIFEWAFRELDASHPHWANLGAYYQMSDSAGTTLTDDSGNSRTGYFFGGMGDANWQPSGAFNPGG